MGVGEETIKNWLTKSPEQLKLSNFEAICKIADTSVYDVFHTLEPESQQYQLDMVDEEVLTQNKELMLLAFLLVNGLELETIRRAYKFDEVELEDNLRVLEKLKIISMVHTNDQPRVHASSHFSWRENGPVENVIRTIIGEFLHLEPDSQSGCEIFIPGMVSDSALMEINEELNEAKRKVYRILDRDSKEPESTTREGFSAYLTSKKWVYSKFKDYRKTL